MSEKFEKTVCFHCASALCGLKSSNLVNLSYHTFPSLKEDLETLNRLFSPKINFTVLKSTETAILVLVWKKEALRKALFCEANYQYLLKHGYSKTKDIYLYIELLKEKLNNNATFPHEIGVFLGYDLDDVIEFEKGNKYSIFTGYWKVYSNLDTKLQTFAKFTKCRNTFISLLDKGYSLELLLK